MATEFISNSWLMPQNSNQDRVSNYSLDFDGTQNINCGDNSVFNNTFTGTAFSFSVWIKSSSNVSYDGILNHGAILQSYLHSNKIKIWLKGSSGYVVNTFTSSATLSSDTWYHIVFTRNGNDNILYINGSSDNSVTSSGSVITTTSDFRIGSYSASQYFFDGKITEVSIYDYALSSSEVTQLYGTGSAIGNPMALSTKPVIYYPLGNSAFNGEFLATNNATELFENYSIDIDGVNDYISVDANPLTNFTTSVWFNRDGNGNYDGILGQGQASPAEGGILRYVALQDADIYLYLDDWYTVASSLPLNTWVHFCLTYDSTADELKSYIDGSLDTTISSPDFSGASTNAHSFKRIGLRNASTATSFPGKMSNVSLFNTALSATQITTLYNSGKPFDLNTFAVTPVAWWRLGGVNSSFDGTNWTFLDEIGTNNATSTNMAQSALVDGVAATGNGVSSGMSSGTNRSDAPYSSSNSVSYNMAVTAKSTSVPT